MFLKNKNIIFKIRRSKVTDYAALSKRKKYKLPEQNKLNKTARLKNALYVKGIFQYTSLMTSVCMRYVGAMAASSYLS